jgi:hypothetical protein
MILRYVIISIDLFDGSLLQGYERMSKEYSICESTGAVITRSAYVVTYPNRCKPSASYVRSYQRNGFASNVFL